MNTDGQLRQLLQLDCPDQASKLKSVTRNNGLPLTASWILEALQAQE
jgi:hypothetical protein